MNVSFNSVQFMKIGRNEKCWCGSGEKYKRCHLDRDRQTPVEKKEVYSFLKKKNLRKYCYAPKELQHECSSKIINAHTVSKSSSLKEIADSTNHVLGLRPDLSALDKNNGVMKLERIGINQASTFQGFCSKHDKEIFSCVEDVPFTGQKNQCFALMYRATAKALYSKEGGVNSNQFLQNSDRGKPLLEQHVIQLAVRSFDDVTRLDLSDISVIKDKLDNFLSKNNRCGEGLKHVVISFERPLPVAISSVVAPFSDFDGSVIQNLKDSSVKAQYMVFNSFSSNGKGYVVFSWFKGNNVIDVFIETLICDDASIFNKLIILFFGTSENLFVSPSWYDCLLSEQKITIERLINTGVSDYGGDYYDVLNMKNSPVDFSQGYSIPSVERLSID